MKVPTRFLVVTNTFLLSVLLYVDRTCISTAKEAITGPLQLSDRKWSWVLAAFAFGYALFQTPGGLLADRWGGRGVLTAVVAAWSLFTGLTAAAWNFVSLPFSTNAFATVAALTFLSVIWRRTSRSVDASRTPLSSSS